MPEDLKVAFEQEFSLNENEVIEKLYQNATPNQYLAQYAVFLLNDIFFLTLALPQD